MAPGKLLGPPEINQKPQPPLNPNPTTAAAAEALPEQKVHTRYGSSTYYSSGNPCLDFFFHVVPDTFSEDLHQRLRLAWDHDPLTTLKLICNLRSVRGTGKSDKNGFYTAALWLHHSHPETLARNVKSISGFGYLKDMLEILYRLLEGPDARENDGRRMVRVGRFNKRIKKIDRAVARTARLERTVAKARKGFQRYNLDPNYRFLHDCIADVFAELLKTDMEFYNSNQAHKISLASKWCPSLGSSYDKATLMCESIARKLFPKSDFIEYQDVADEHYAFRVRDRLRKEVLVPLRRALELPEVYMCANKWDEVPYDRLTSVALKQYQKLFQKHDQERFEEFLEKVMEGKAKVSAGALLPHEIIKSLGDSDKAEEVAELQWKRMVDDLAKDGRLKNCLAVCDVYHMHGTPKEVSASLGLLISELSEGPWKGKLLTFSNDPCLHNIEGNSLPSKMDFIRSLKGGWYIRRDLNKVFDKILEVAVSGNLEQEQMIRRLFVFTDMEFEVVSGSCCTRRYVSGFGHGHSYSDSDSDESSRMDTDEPSDTTPWETNYRLIQKKYAKKGYKKVPEIVFWNLRDSTATPVLSTQQGVAMVSGFSQNLVRMFLEEGDGIMSPEAFMQKAISGDEYQKLAVFD